jgi:hypothetical protein
VRQLISLLVIAWLPGALLFRLPCMDRDRRAALDSGERTFWAIILSLALSLVLALLLGALGRYSFQHLLIVNGSFSLLTIAALRGRLRLAGAHARSPVVLLPVALAALALWRFSPPSEYVMGGKDPGTYMNEGIQIAQRGSILIHDDTVAAVPPFARDLFFPRHTDGAGNPRSDYYGIRFMGFPIRDPDSGVVVGQFPHLFPASIALGYGIDGLTGARWVTPAWAALGVLAVFFVAARLFGRVVAAVAAVLLALNVISVWFGRYPNAEVVMQAFVFAALLANARAHVDGDRFFAPVAGCLLGLLLFLRFDAVLAIGGVSAGLILAVVAGQRPTLPFAAALVLTAAAAVPYMLGPMRAYAEYPIGFVKNLRWWHVAALVATASAIVATTAIAQRTPRVRDRLSRAVPLVLAAVLVVAGAYALLLRHPGGRLAAHDAYALRTFANFYVTVPVALAAMIGYALSARRSFWRDPALFVTFAVFSLFLFYKIRIVPEHFWAARRFLPVILPGVLLFASAAAVGISGRGWRATLLRPLLGGIFVVLVGSHYVRASAPVADHVEYAGLIPKLEQLASHFHDNDLVIVEGRDAQSDVHVVALPLAYIYARHVLELKPARPDKPTFAAFLEWARTRYARVFFVGGGGTDLLSFRYGVTAVGSERFQVPEYESAINAYPRGARRKEFEFGIYEFTPGAATPSATAPVWFDLDIGTNDDLHVLRFHAKEQTEGRSFRWTRARSYVSVTTLTENNRELTMMLSDGGRPAAAPPAKLEVFLHGELLGSATVSGPFRRYAFNIPPELARSASAVRDPVELRLVTVTWNPLQVLGTPDDRDLGVMVDRVTIK